MVQPSTSSKINLSQVASNPEFIRYVVRNILSQNNLIQESGGTWRLALTSGSVHGLSTSQSFQSQDAAVDAVIQAYQAQFQNVASSERSV